MPAILHLEDDELDHKLVLAALARDGLADDVVRAVDEDQYRRALEERCFDLIIADYNLPRFDGRRALEVAEERCPDVPFILLSGAMGETAAVEILKAGATDVVLKDRTERLIPAVRRALREAADRAARQHAEDRLRASEARLRYMVESVRDFAIFSLDPQGIIATWNVGAECLFGLHEPEIVGRHFRHLFMPEDQTAGMPERLLATAVAGGRADDDRQHRLPDGRQIYVSGVITPVYDDGHALRGFTKVARDVTERVKHDADLRRARDDAEAANRAKDQFLAVLSHELRTPLTPVLTTAQVLERDASIDERTRAAFAMIRRNVELEARLIDDLLDLTRIGRGKMEFNFTDVDADEKVEHVLQMCLDDARAKGVEVTADLGAGTCLVRADAARLQQVIWNLLKNAIKFTPAGGKVRVRTFCEAGEGHWRFEIRDTGIGIDAALLPKLFEPFEQGGKDVTRLFGGLGLGLTISRGIALSHGGALTAASEGAGRGATFVFNLPTAIAARTPAGESASGARGGESADRVRGRRVLLVEDNADTAGVMAMVLRMSGFEVRVANSVAAALKTARAEQPDVLISDIGLPDGSGLDLMRQLRTVRPVPGIALSGYGQEEDVRRSRDAGFVEHLTKPIDIDALDRAVRRVAAMTASG